MHPGADRPLAIGKKPDDEMVVGVYVERLIVVTALTKMVTTHDLQRSTSSPFLFWRFRSFDMKTNSNGPIGIKIGEGAKNNTFSGVRYHGPGIGLEIESGATGNKFDNVSVTAVPRRCAMWMAVRIAHDQSKNPTPPTKHSKGWSGQYEANWPFNRKS